MTPYYRESQNQQESEMNALKNHQIMSPKPAASKSRVVERLDEELRDNAGSICSQRLEEEGGTGQMGMV